MNKKIILMLFACVLSSNAYAQAVTDQIQENEEIQETRGSLRANFKRVGLDLSSTEVRNADRYQNSSITALNADGETLIRGVFDFALEYETENNRWDNSLYMIYGRRKTRPVNRPNEINKSDDKILINTDYAHRFWDMGEANVGPFVNLGYETNFTTENGNPRTKIIRTKTGLKLFSGKNFSDLYIAAVNEYDMTHDKDNTKFAAEIGMTASFPIRDGVNIELNGYYRDFFSFSVYEPEDLKYDLNAEARMNVRIVDSLKLDLSPFARYRYAESRGAGKAGSNFSIGLSLTFTEIYNLW